MVEQNRFDAAKTALTAGLICLLVYLRAVSCNFVNWDDTDYVLNNMAIRSLDRDFFITIFTTIPYDFYIPLTTISLAIDYHFWGLNPAGYHLTNILLHAANTGMLVLVADRILQSHGAKGKTLAVGGGTYLYPATLLLAGLLWGLHPLRVESVAWVTERKDVLNGIFTLCSMYFYLKYVRERERGEGGRALYGGYVPSFIFFLMSLMSKPSSLVLPFMLLILDWYPLMRFKREKIAPLLLEKLPFIVFSLGIIPASMLRFAELDTFHSTNFFPLHIRAIVSGNALFEYFRLMLFPVGILPFYDLPLAIPKIFILKTALVVMFLLLVLYWGRKRPWLISALACFIVPILPVLPFLGNGASIALAARYTYLPALLPSILVAALGNVYYRKLALSGCDTLRKVLVASAVLILICYAGMTQKQIGVWKNSGTMWTRVIEHQPFDKAYFYRGLYFADSGNYASAVEDYSSCLTIAISRQLPEIYNLYAFRGEALLQAGRFEEAVADLNRAISLFPHQLYYYHRSLALKGLGRLREADDDQSRAGRARGKMFWFPVGSSPTF